VSIDTTVLLGQHSRTGATSPFQDVPQPLLRSVLADYLNRDENFAGMLLQGDLAKFSELETKKPGTIDTIKLIRSKEELIKTEVEELRSILAQQAGADPVMAGQELAPTPAPVSVSYLMSTDNATDTKNEENGFNTEEQSRRSLQPNPRPPALSPQQQPQTPIQFQDHPESVAPTAATDPLLLEGLTRKRPEQPPVQEQESKRRRIEPSQFIPPSSMGSMGISPLSAQSTELSVPIQPVQSQPASGLVTSPGIQLLLKMRSSQKPPATLLTEQSTKSSDPIQQSRLVPPPFPTQLFRFTPIRDLEQLLLSRLLHQSTQPSDQIQPLQLQSGINTQQGASGATTGSTRGSVGHSSANGDNNGNGQESTSTVNQFSTLSTGSKTAVIDQSGVYDDKATATKISLGDDSKHEVGKIATGEGYDKYVERIFGYYSMASDNDQRDYLRNLSNEISKDSKLTYEQKKELLNLLHMMKGSLTHEASEDKTRYSHYDHLLGLSKKKSNRSNRYLHQKVSSPGLMEKILSPASWFHTSIFSGITIVLYHLPHFVKSKALF